MKGINKPPGPNTFMALDKPARQKGINDFSIHSEQVKTSEPIDAKEVKISNSDTENKLKSGVQIQNRLLTLHVLGRLAKGKSQKQIALDLGATKPLINYHVKKLVKMGFIRQTHRSRIAFFEVLEPGKTALRSQELKLSSYPTTAVLTPDLEVHDLYIEIPILSRPESPLINTDNPIGFWDKVNEGFRNSLQRHADAPCINASVRETSRHIIIQVRPSKIESVADVLSIANRASGYVIGELYTRQYRLDLANSEIKNAHWWLRDPEIKKAIEKGLKITVPLGRPREKLLPGDPEQPAYAEGCTTPELGRESNDLKHTVRALLQPEYTAEIHEAVHRMEELIKGTVNQQVAISNAIMSIGSALSRQTTNQADTNKILAALASRPAPQPSNEASPAIQEIGDMLKLALGNNLIKQDTPGALDKYVQPKEEEVQLLTDLPRFATLYRGTVRTVGPFPAGARIWLDSEVVNVLVSRGAAKRVEDKARGGPAAG